MSIAKKSMMGTSRNAKQSRNRNVIVRRELNAPLLEYHRSSRQSCLEPNE